MQPRVKLLHPTQFNIMRAPTPSEPIRVLFVDHTAQLGGGEIALRNLARALDPSRVSTKILLFANGPLVEQLGEGNHSVHVLPLSTRISQTRKDAVGWKSLLKLGDLVTSLLFVFRLARLIRNLKVDVVHTNSLKAHVLGGIAARLVGVPVIWHLRDRIAPDYLPRSAVQLVRFLARFLPHFVIANSRATLETISPQHSQNSSSSHRFKVIHDGCLLPSGREASDPDGPLSIGMVGRISPWKGQHVFVKAAAIVRDIYPEASFEIIGAPLFSETAYEQELRTLASSFQLEGNLRFTGFINDIGSTFERLQIVVHASIIGEPFGQVIIEGMAAGKPVIATQSGGIPEIVEDGATGLLIPPKDEHALARAMIFLLRNPERAAQMGLQGRERVKNLFTIERHARAVEQVYVELLRSRHNQWPRFEQQGLESA
jgi:glycosyltransferase involved in cell wall biosynthesis